jgi:hypothetical protein
MILRDRTAAVGLALMVALLIGGLILLPKSATSKQKPGRSGKSSFLVMIENCAVGEVCELLTKNDIQITSMYGSRSTQLQVAEEDLPRATELVSQAALERNYSVSFSGFLGEREPKRVALKQGKALDEILKEPQAREGTPFGEVLRHAVVRREAKSLPFVTETESLTYELDPKSTRTDVLHFFKIGLAKQEGSGTSGVVFFQFKEGGWPIQVSERFYGTLRKMVREQ